MEGVTGDLELSERTERVAEDAELAVGTQKNENRERDVVTNRDIQCDGGDSDVTIRDGEDAGSCKACQDAQGVT